MRKCSQCNQPIHSQHPYCPNCDAENTSNRDKKENVKRLHGKAEGVNHNQNYKILAEIVIALAIIVSIYWVNLYSFRYSQGQIVPTTVNKIAIPAQETQISQGSDLYQVASYFYCSCGDCQDPELVTCGCPTAKSQRDFIQKNLDDGKSVKEVRVLVSQTYGKLKPEQKFPLDEN